FLKSYLNVYSFDDFSAGIRGIVNALCDLLATSDFSFGQKLQRIFQDIDEKRRECEDRMDFLSQDVCLAFLDGIENLLEDVEKDSSDKFSCAITLRRPPPNALDRRYPLFEANRIMRVKVPLVNEGPGVAYDVTA